MSHRRRILCVDDNADTCFMLETLFRRDGYEITSAGSADDALKLARTGHFDLFIIDSRLPDQLGIDLCRSLKAASPASAIIFYTGLATDAGRAAGLRAGAQDYITKPDIDQLIAAVRRTLAANPPQ